MPLTSADLGKIRSIVREEVMDRKIQNLGTDETGDTTTLKLIAERDHKRTTDNTVKINEIHAAIVKGAQP